MASFFIDKNMNIVGIFQIAGPMRSTAKEEWSLIGNLFHLLTELIQLQ
jgi:hypothetical protein